MSQMQTIESIADSSHEGIGLAITGCRTIDSTTNDNGFLNCARSKNPGAGGDGSTREAVDRLVACVGSGHNSSSIVGHGNDGLIVTGEGQHLRDPAKFITTWNQRNWESELARLKGKVTGLQLWACHPGTAQAGADLLYQIAKVINAPVYGPTGFLYCSSSRPDLYLEPKSVWQVATPTSKPNPIDAPSHHLDYLSMKIILEGAEGPRVVPIENVASLVYTDARHKEYAFKLEGKDAHGLLELVLFDRPEKFGIPAAIETGRLTITFESEKGPESREFIVYNNRLLQDLKAPEVTYHVSQAFTTALSQIR